MKRDPRLHPLSSDHHHALALARRAARAAAEPSGPAADAVWREVRSLFLADLTPHFDVEERILLPALRAAGEVELVERTLAEHAAIRACVADEGEVRSRLATFATLLTEHVRFEERVLFEVAQARLPETVLEEVLAGR